MAGIWGCHPGGPARLLDVDATVFLAFMEGVLRDSSEDNVKALDRLYADAQPAAPRVPTTREARRAEIARFARMTSGTFA